MSSRAPISVCSALLAVVLLSAVPGFSQQTKSIAAPKPKPPLAAAKTQFAKHDLKSRKIPTKKPKSTWTASKWKRRGA